MANLPLLMPRNRRFGYTDGPKPKGAPDHFLRFIFYFFHIDSIIASAPCRHPDLRLQNYARCLCRALPSEIEASAQWNERKRGKNGVDEFNVFANGA